VHGVDLAAFIGDECVLPRLADGRYMRPGGTREPGEYWVLTAIRELREETGCRLLTLHPVGTLTWEEDGREFVRVVAWCDAERDGEPTNPPDAEHVVDVALVQPSTAARLLAESGWPWMAELLEHQLAARNAGMDDDTWFRDTQRLLEEAYLAAPDVYAQSGKGGGTYDDWELGRRVISRAIDRDGTFIDMCCANGLLMETMVPWCAAAGHAIEPYGLDISARLIALARQRLPHWHDRFFVGNALTWQPPRRFDFVYTLLDIVPDHRRRDLVQHLLDHVVADGGRLIIGGYSVDPRAELSAVGFTPDGECVQDRGDRAPVHIVWLNQRPDVL